jgi:hypothetical protein
MTLTAFPSCTDRGRPTEFPVAASGEHLERQFARTQTAAY